MGDGRDEGTGVRLPIDSEDTLRLNSSTLVRLLSGNSSGPGVNGLFSDAIDPDEPGGGDTWPREDEMDPRCDVGGRGEAALCRSLGEMVGD